MHPHCNARSLPTESINFSCTFDGTLKQTREPPAKRDVTATRDGFGEQLIDLSKHLHRSFWTSKVGKKNRVLEIEERLGLFTDSVSESPLSACLVDGFR